MKKKQKVPVRGAEMLKELLLFYVPLGLYSMIMMSSHSVINSGVSRAPDAEIGLAAFAVTMTIMNMFASPCFTSRQMVVALAHDKKSLKITRNVMVKIAAVSLLFLSILAFTPIGEFVFVNLFNTPENLMSEVKTAAVLTLSLPFVYSLRSYSQGIIIVEKKTKYLTYTVLIRISFMVFLAFALPKLGFISGASIGIIIWTAGMGLEAIINYLFSRRVYKNLPDTPNYDSGEEDFTQLKAFNFIWPLLLMSFIWTLGLPVINSGLGFTKDPDRSIATFQVARSYAWIAIAFLEMNMRQVSLIFGTSEDRISYLKRFTLGVSIVLASIIAILALTPVGNWGLINIIGVTDELAQAVKPVLVVLIALPLVLAKSEYYMGLLMKLNNTKALSIGKIISIALAGVSVIALSILLPQLGAVVGAIGLVLGYSCEMLYLKYTYHKMIG
ncbi:MAG: hypothetical protein ACLFPS_08290 [Clostridia bacterium]